MLLHNGKPSKSEANRRIQHREMEQTIKFFLDSAEFYCERSIDPLTSDERTFYYEEQCYVMLFAWIETKEKFESIDWRI